MREAVLIEDKGRGLTFEVLVEGSGPDVVLVPSAMRGAKDFAMLQAALTKAGYRSLAMHPRCAGRSKGPLVGLTLRDIADDIAFVANELAGGKAHLVGHALGNIGVRAAASFRPEVAHTVSVMPCGGHNLGANPVSEAVIAAMPRCHDESLPREERLAALHAAFFAPGNDPSVWLTDWWPRSAGIAHAIGTVDPELWWRGGDRPILVIQPLNDAMASNEAGRATAAALGSRCTYVEVDNCGHAILPEQPEAIARHVIAFLDANSG
jgi:pimeloyl-ACP methyl ester carboxylesterase